MKYLCCRNHITLFIEINEENFENSTKNYFCCEYTYHTKMFAQWHIARNSVNNSNKLWLLSNTQSCVLNFEELSSNYFYLCLMYNKQNTYLNTSTPHEHIVVRGLRATSRPGRPTYRAKQFPKRFITRPQRWHAGDTKSNGNCFGKCNEATFPLSQFPL